MKKRWLYPIIIYRIAQRGEILHRHNCRYTGLSVALAPVGALLGSYLGKIIPLYQVILVFGGLIVLVAVFWKNCKGIRKMTSINDLNQRGFDGE